MSSSKSQFNKTRMIDVPNVGDMYVMKMAKLPPPSLLAPMLPSWDKSHSYLRKIISRMPEFEIDDTMLVVSIDTRSKGTSTRTELELFHRGALFKIQWPGMFRLLVGYGAVELLKQG